MKALIQEVLTYLSSKDPKLCVIATSLNDRPECAVMGYAVLPDLSIIMSTDNISKKWRYLKQNHFVALTFGWTFEELNIQYEGIAKAVEKGPLFKECETKYFADHPEALEFKGLPETVFIKVTPTWIRLSDYDPVPPRIVETKM